MFSPTSFDDRYEEPDRLRDQLRQLLRYRTTIALGIALGLLGGLLLVVFRAGSYTSTSEVLVRPTTDPFSTLGVSVENQVSMGTERQIALSATVAARAAKALHQPSRADTLLENLRVTNPPETQVLRFEYSAGTPKGAARGSNAFAEAYLADRKDRTKATVKRMTSGLEKHIAALTKQNTKKADAGTAASRRDQIGALQKRISDITSYDTKGGDIVRGAEPPAQPSGPGPAWLIGLGLLSGLLLGIVLAWLRSALEPRARSVGEVQGALGAPVLGILPGPDADHGDLLEVGRIDGSRAETYRSLAFRLRYGEARTGTGTLLVVASKQDHKAEAVAVNLAAAFAEFGDEVLLVDATASTPGLSVRLPLVEDDSGAPEGRAVIDAGRAGRFMLFPDRSGTAPYDLPASATVTRALSSADSDMAAFVLTRPLLEHADALGVAQRVDGVLVVGGLDDTRRDDLKRIRELIGCAGGHIVGAVLDTGTRRGLLRRAMDSGRPRRLRERGSSTTPAAPAEDVVGKQSAPVPDDTLTTSR
ncbi:hypothetical protein AB0I77_31190 [Streptomyces sp. NPDC050619]|uniref:hypothetical protein n=1 Tax=Streptomyces sp. NPDC050619 TaxID=3157214 RepID=UPI00342A23D7